MWRENPSETTRIHFLFARGRRTTCILSSNRSTYQKKRERADSLKQTLINLGLGSHTDVVKKVFLFLGKALNQWEEEAQSY